MNPDYNVRTRGGLTSNLQGCIRFKHKLCVTLGKHDPHVLTCKRGTSICSTGLRWSTRGAGSVTEHVGQATSTLLSREGRALDPWFQTNPEGRVEISNRWLNISQSVSFHGVTQKKGFILANKFENMIKQVSLLQDSEMLTQYNIS